MICNIVVYDLEHLANVRGFAESINAQNEFSRAWSRLTFLAANYATNPSFKDVTLHIGKDWAEHSFSWAIKAQGEKTGNVITLLNGGLIYHGKAQTENNFSVRLTASVDHEWCLHT